MGLVLSPLGTKAYLGAVACDPRVKASGLRSANIVSQFFNKDDGEAYPSIALMAELSGRTQTTILAGLRNLEAVGWLEVEWSKGGRPHVYKPACATGWEYDPGNRYNPPKFSRVVPTRVLTGSTHEKRNPNIANLKSQPTRNDRPTHEKPHGEQEEQEEQEQEQEALRAVAAAQESGSKAAESNAQQDDDEPIVILDDEADAKKYLNRIFAMHTPGTMSREAKAQAIQEVRAGRSLVLVARWCQHYAERGHRIDLRDLPELLACAERQGESFAPIESAAEVPF